MDIRYNIGDSRFVKPCEDAIRANRNRLDAGDTVEISLTGEKPGYAERIEVEIRDNDTATFGTDWTSSDVSRFPARIKAAATALLNCGCFGCFVIEHRDGLLTIRIA